MLTLQDYLQLSLPSNTKSFFLAAMVTAVNNYAFKNSSWELLRPIANYFSAKMEENNKLHLSIIPKLVWFL
jgi:hypothetical protein